MTNRHGLFVLAGIVLLIATSFSALASPQNSPAVRRSSVKYLVKQPDASAAASAPILTAGASRVDGEYLVRLRDDILFEDVPAVTTQVAAVVGATVKRVWSSVIKGFFVKMTEQQAALMARSPLVRSIEENATWYSSGTVTQTNINPAICDPATTSNCTTVADDRLWHLDRMDQNTPSIDNKYTYCSTGQNVKVYVVDTGVERSHVEFGGNAAKVLDGSNTSGDMMPAWNPCRGWAVPPSGAHANLENEYYAKEVNNGHGTAVAGLIAGSRTGVAKNAIIVPVKTVRCDQNAARWWRPSQTYSTGQTVFRVALNAAQEYYIADWFVATTGGLSGGSEPNWNLNLNPAGSTQDNQVIWKHLDPGEIDVYHQDTTDKLLDGLIWVYQDSQASQGHEILSISKFVPWSEGMRKLNTSLGSKSVDDLIAMLVDSGVVVITSANNHNGNACDTSPANLSLNRPVAGDPAIDNLTRKVITVGGSMLVNRPWITNAPSGSTAADGGVNFGTTEPAYERTKSVREARWICGSGDSDFCDNTTATDTVEPARQASWLGGSNGGPCVTLFAPAKNVFVASIKASDDYRDARLRNTYASGTSFSAPIVAGLAARILENHPAYGPTEMRTELLANCESTMEDSGTSGAFPLNPKWMHRDANNDQIVTQLTDTPNKVLIGIRDFRIVSGPSSTPANSSGTTALTVSSDVTTGITYQWFQVNGDFDLATYKRGAFSSTQVNAATAATYNAPQPTGSTPIGYWVRLSNGCSSVDSDIAVIVPRPVAPTNVYVSVSGNSVTVAWNTLTGFAYRVERKVAGAAWTTAQGQTSSGSFTESPATPNGIAVYRVRALAGMAYLASNNLAVSDIVDNYHGVIANILNAGYEPLEVRVTKIKAAHVTQIRAAENALCAAIELPPPYTPPELDPNAIFHTPVNATHITSLMQYINSTRTLMGLQPVSFDTPVASHAVIKRDHIMSLRNALQ